jgi:hypothetical protein
MNDDALAAENAQLRKALADLPEKAATAKAAAEAAAAENERLKAENEKLKFDLELEREQVQKLNAALEKEAHKATAVKPTEAK